MRRLVALPATTGRDFVTELQRVWRRGDAVLPVDPRLPEPAARSLVAAMRTDDPVEHGDALVIPTSGTGGSPKGVVLTHEAIEASARATSERLDVDPTLDTWLCILPVAHVGGLGVVTRALLTKTPLTFNDGDAATLVSVVATQLRRLDLAHFRRVLVGGGPPPGLIPPNAVVTWGMTETASGVVYDGRPLTGVEVRVLDGELLVRGPMLLRGYRDGNDPKDPDGWFRTGDGGEILSDGSVNVHGRLADVVVTGGEKVWPDPVEALLRSLPRVRDIAIAGRRDEEWGQRVVAWVVPADQHDPPSLDELRDAVRAHLPPWCAPKELVLIEQLPRTLLGKLRRRELR